MRVYRGQTALVTGAGSGIGRAIATVLAGAGARVIATDLSEDRLRELQASLATAALACETAVLDVADGERFREVAAQHGPIDVLVNNAGVGLAGEVQDTSLADWRRVFEINTMGVVHGIEAVYGTMVARGAGRIINVASGAGLLPRPGMVPYAASKAAVLGLSMSFRPEAAAYGVQVHVVCPGYIATDIMNATKFKGVDGAGLQAAIPLQPMSAQRCAEILLRSAARGRAIIPVTTPTWVEWWLTRLSPRLALKIASVRATKFRQHRLI